MLLVTPLIAMVRERNTRKSGITLVAAEKVRGQLRELCGALQTVYPRIKYGVLWSCSPSLITDPNLYVLSVKRFCGGLLEGESHPWRPHLGVVGRRQRFSIAGSLFLFRKVLPSPEADLASYMSQMETPQKPADPKFLSFCKRRIASLFRVGWDRNYTKLPGRVVIPTHSCLELGMSERGQRELIACGDSWLNRQVFCEYVLSSSHALRFKPSRVCAVETGGKNRIVSVPSVDMNVLRPLHTCMYDHLSRFRWLLRGDAVPNRFKDFTASSGEVFISGDYESATDNLNTEVQEFILREVLEQACWVPKGVQATALASLRMSLSSGGKIIEQCRGQLMGNLLSFPLLCLVNYLAFKWLVPRSVPLRINGDDIVFRATTRECDRWVKGVGDAGLTLSVGKTIRSERFFSLNSCFFEARRTVVKAVPVIRSKAFFGSTSEGVMSLRDRFFASFRWFDRVRKDKLAELFLSVNKRFVHASGRSVRSGLGLPVSQEILKRTGLFLREVCYTSQGRYLPEVALSFACKASSPYKIEGWHLVRTKKTKELRQLQEVHTALITQLTWELPVREALLRSEGLEREEVLVRSNLWDGQGVLRAGSQYVRAPLPQSLDDLSRRRDFIKQTSIDYSGYFSALKRRVAVSAAMCRVSRNSIWATLIPKQLPPIVAKDGMEDFWCPDVPLRSRSVVFLSRGFVHASS